MHCNYSLFQAITENIDLAVSTAVISVVMQNFVLRETELKSYVVIKDGSSELGVEEASVIKASKLDDIFLKVTGNKDYNPH